MKDLDNTRGGITFFQTLVVAVVGGLVTGLGPMIVKSMEPWRKPKAVEKSPASSEVTTNLPVPAPNVATYSAPNASWHPRSTRITNVAPIIRTAQPGTPKEPLPGRMRETSFRQPESDLVPVPKWSETEWTEPEKWTVPQTAQELRPKSVRTIRFH